MIGIPFALACDEPPIFARWSLPFERDDSFTCFFGPMDGVVETPSALDAHQSCVFLGPFSPPPCSGLGCEVFVALRFVLVHGGGFVEVGSGGG